LLFPNVSGERASGPGVVREIFSALESLLIQSKAESSGRLFFQQLPADDLFYTLALRPSDHHRIFPSTTNDQAFLRGVGLFLRLCLTWDITPYLISPFLFNWVITGDRWAGTDTDFTKAVYPELAKRLDTFPPSEITLDDGTAVLDIAAGTDPYNLMVHLPRMESYPVRLIVPYYSISHRH
jgi:hypothetical protein